MKKLLVLFLILIGLAVVVAVVAIGVSDGPATIVGSDRVLTLTLDSPLVDYAPTPRVPFFEIEQRQSLASIFRAVRRARKDPHIQGMSVTLRWTSMGLGQAQEVHRLLRSMATAGKFVTCYLETAGEGTNGTLAYYLATACDSIHIAPAGDLNLVGVYLDSVFLRGTLDKLEIEPQYDHVGQYKSASETYTEYEHSAPAEEALSTVLDDIFDQLVSTIAERRSKSAEEVRRLIDGAPYTAVEALDLGLVDHLSYPDEFEDAVDELAGGEANLVSTENYPLGSSFGGKRVALLFAQGIIVRGDSGRDPWTSEMYLGSDDFGKLLDQLGEDDSIDAVILRINSPGGSALASDLILRQVERLAENKPVVVSMSSVAASGGYYIAAKAARIVAEASTLTGSIGVVGGKLVTRRFQRELLGISHDPLQRGANAGFFSSLETFSPEQARRFKELMQRTYETFVGHVVEGRGLSEDQVLAVAGGRIWTGSQALERGLVDELGGLDRALEMVAEDLGLESAEELNLALYPAPPSLFDFLEESSPLGATARLEALRRALEPRQPDLLEVPPELLRATHPF